MKGALLSSDEFLSLLNAESYQEFLRILGTTRYAAALLEKDSGDISFSALTNIVYRSLFIDYEKTIRAVKEEMQKFFILLYRKYEVINLKTVLRGICSDLTPDKVAPLLQFDSQYYANFCANSHHINIKGLSANHHTSCLNQMKSQVEMAIQELKNELNGK